MERWRWLESPPGRESHRTDMLTMSWETNEAPVLQQLVVVLASALAGCEGSLWCQPAGEQPSEAGRAFFSFVFLWSDATLFSIAQLEAAVGERERERDKRDAAE